ncbi:MAG: hypothetical protein DRJ38_05750 [Thermoprotei archaeon]|nr:MAG: hypothetical protein DRJ38_05750 [Thermoprotei archaeon]
MELLDLIIREGKNLGAGEILASYRIARRLRVEIENNEVTRANQSVEKRIAINVVIDKRLATATTTIVSKEEILKIIRTAVNMAKASKPNRYWSELPDPKPLPKVGKLYDKNLVSLSAGEITEMAWETVEAALSLDERVSVSDGLIESVIMEKALATSKGFKGEEKGTLIWGYVSAVAKEHGEVGSFSFSIDASRELKVDFAELGRKAAKLAIESLGAKPVESFKGTLVMDPDVAWSFFSTFSSAYKADNVWKGSSPLAGKIGESIASSNLTIIDNGVMEGGTFSSLFDEEGSPRRETLVLNKGVLKRYISNTYIGNILGIEVTGNAASLLDVAPTNTVVLPGDMSEEEILEDVKRGIYVRRFSGDMRFQDGVVSGVAKQAFYIENGELKFPVKECMISSNLYDMLKNITGIGNKIEKKFNVYTPMIRIENIKIIGK